MSYFLKFNILRSVQGLSKEAQDNYGTRTHTGTLSTFATTVLGHLSSNEHDEIYDDVTGFLASSAAISDLSQVDPLLRTAFDLLQQRGKKITAADLNGRITSTALNAYVTATAPEYEKDRRAVEDTLLALALFGKLGDKRNLNYILLLRALELIKLAQPGGAFFDKQIATVLTKPVMIPSGRYNPCTKKYASDDPFAYLEIESTVRPPASEEEEGGSHAGSGIGEPGESEESGGSKAAGDCGCGCADAGCEEPDPCCAELRLLTTDLMIVREELNRYEPHHLAYIENIMQGEKRIRHHRTLDRTETFTETETETTKSLEKDHEVEDRFSLKSEIEKTIDEDLSIKAGVEFSGEFGTNKYGTHFDLSYDLAKSESQQIAQEYARNVVTRSISKVEERVRQTKSVRIISESEEKNTHIFTNVPGTKHIVGQYHYVNMINRLQVMNYGKRLMFEFVLPEPMELYKKLLEKNILPFGQKEPVKPLVRIDQINPGPFKDDAHTIPTDKYSENTDALLGPLLGLYDENGLFNYIDLIKYFELTGIEPMPDPDIRIPFSFGKDKKVQGNNEILTFDIELGTIPQGYNGRILAVDMKGYDTEGFVSTAPDDGGTQIDLEWFVDGVHSGAIPGVAGDQWKHRSDPAPQIVNIDATQGSRLTLTVMAKSCAGFSGSGYVTCLLSDQAKIVWKTKVFEAIMAKYQQLLEDYKTALARYEQEKAAKLPYGNNPFINREIERTELKRLAIEYISCQFFDRFNAMKRNNGPCGYPEMNLVQAQKDGAFIQFFEQLFDWGLMTYLFYPYFWGQKCSWAEKVQVNSGDPLFDKALMAGAARVQVPVHQGHELLAVHWVNYGEIWMGQSEPPLPSSPYYISMAQEIKEQNKCFYVDREGTLDVTNGSEIVTRTGSTEYGLNPLLIEADINREIIIDFHIYRIISIVPNGVDWDIELDRPYEGATDSDVLYQTGAIFVGAPFEVVVPTNLIFLRNIPDGSGGYVASDCLPKYPLDSCS